MKTYHIKSGYQPRTGGHSSTVHEGYWTPSRIYASGFHQYQVYRFAMDYIRSHGVRSVLDLGCGPGTKLALIHEKFPDLKYLGIDLPEGVAYCRKTYDFGEWLSVDFNVTTQVDLNSKVDLVICSDVIEHVEDPDRLLEFVRGRLSPAGRVILSTPDRDRLNGRANNTPLNAHHVREWNRSELAAYLQSAGFEIEWQGLQFPVRFWPNGIFWREIVKRMLTGKSARYNQVVLLSAK